MMPLISVVLCTYNRAQQAEQATRRILAQEFAGDRSFEVVVVNDGSSDDTSEHLRRISDPRVRLVEQVNMGLAAARNAGIRAARGEWLVFVDDDDEPLPGWLSALSSFDNDPTCGIVSCSTYVVKGGKRRLELVGRLGPLFFDEVGLFLAGTFSVRRELLDRAGHFLTGFDGLSHQYELAMRLVPAARETGLRLGVVPEPFYVVNQAGPLERPLANPTLVFDSTRWLLARHGSRYECVPRMKAQSEAIAGVAAARCSRWKDAQVFLLRSVRTYPWLPKNWARLGLSMFPPLATLAWRSTQRRAGHAADRRGLLMEGSRAATLPVTDQDRYFLPWRYKQNPVTTAKSGGAEYWEGPTQQRDRYQEPVYRWASKLILRHGWRPVVDVGCGTGRKLVRIIGQATADFVGVDQAAAVEVAKRAHPAGRWVSGDLVDPSLWRAIGEYRPALTICADVIEHVQDPRELLCRMRCALAPGGRLLISTPDRSRLEGARDLGPPSNAWHVREWTPEEFVLLLESCGFKVVSQRHLLPRSYAVSILEMRRLVGRIARMKPVPDPRACMAFLVTPTTLTA